MSTQSLIRRHGRRAFIASATAVVVTASLSPAVHAAADTAMVYAVVQEGLTPDDGAALAEAFGVGNALYANGAFRYVDGERFQYVPQVKIGEGEDEDGNPTVSSEVDVEALRGIEPYPEEAALESASRLAKMALLSEGMEASPTVSHSVFTLSDDEGKVAVEQPLDTQVGFSLTLGGLPVTGQGAKLHLSFGSDGTVTELSQSLRRVTPDGEAPIIGVDEAREVCARLYPGQEQLEPTLGYEMPPLTATEANGEGTVKFLYPQYTCHPADEKADDKAGRTVPAVPDAAPTFTIDVERSGDAITGTSDVTGGTEPYTYAWSSSSTGLVDNTKPEISYQRSQRGKDGAETLTLTVTDANGMSAAATVEINADGSASAASLPGGGGALSVGIENPVQEWACAQASVNGFKSVMQSHGAWVKFDWRGAAAFESDFKDAAFGGRDSHWVDDVDMQWYTGHGSPNGITFDSSVNHRLTPAEARWGNDWNLEWLQLESCQVLRDITGSHDYIDRWGQAFDGLHMMNGFHTNARCLSTTGGTFAAYLFPYKFLWWTLRPAYSVRTAWATMALTQEPDGYTYRSFGPARWTGSGWLTNVGDHYWGQGSTGPDIQPTGWWWTVTGTA